MLNADKGRENNFIRKNMQQIKFTGGARIGMSNATWPFATLTVSKNRLDLNATVVGNYTFTSEDIISFEPYSGMMSSGLKINHRVSKYKDKVIFWTFKNPQTIINEIRKIGFLDPDKSDISTEIKREIAEKQKQGGFPLKIPFAIFVIVVWNILFFMDFLNSSDNPRGVPIGNGAIGALGFVLALCILILVSKDFRKFVLKEGRELKDISKFVYFIMFISGFMMISFLLISNF